MKLQYKLSYSVAALAGFAAVSFSVFAVELAPHLKSAEPSSAEVKADQQQKSEREAVMKRTEAEISDRVGMTACLEATDVGDEDFVEMAAEQGLIMEATIEEVESALKAAAATPGNADDLAAMRLAHWGSYRFYLDAKPPIPLKTIAPAFPPINTAAQNSKNLNR